MTMEETGSNDRTESELKALRAALLSDEAMPIGLTARLEAAVVQAAEAEGPPWSARIVVAAVAFVVIGMAAGDRLGATAALIAGGTALVYVSVFAAALRRERAYQRRPVFVTTYDYAGWRHPPLTAGSRIPEEKLAAKAMVPRHAFGFPWFFSAIPPRPSAESSPERPHHFRR